MAILDATSDRHAPGRRRAWSPWAALGLALLCATSYVVALVLPYYANDLHLRPAGETLYLYDLGTLWPYDSALAVPVGWLAIWALGVGPFASFGTAVWSGHRLWTTRGTPDGRAATAAALVVSVATLAWLATPLNAELMVWLVD